MTLQRACRLLAVTLLLLSSGCQDPTKTFAGFTYGGGGKTYSCEPAVWSAHATGFELRSGLDGQETFLVLQGQGAPKMGEPNPLASAAVTIPGQSELAELVSGSLVPQSQDAQVAHGSFDLKVKTKDGREFAVVGSYTASLAGP